MMNKSLKYTNGDEVTTGDVIRWFSFDSDDFTTWEFTGIYFKTHVVYLGGGIDFGMAIGKKIDLSEVIKESEANDQNQQGIFRVCKAMDIVRLVNEIPIKD